MNPPAANSKRSVFVAGATGVLGRRTVGSLVAAGHRVRGIARSDEKAALLRGLGAEPVRIDLCDRDAVAEAVVGSEVVINLATHIPPFREALDVESWATNDRLRTEGAANLRYAAEEAGALRFVQESLGFMYPDHGDRWIDESVAPDPGSVAETALEAEATARSFADAADGRRAIILRFGQLYSADSDHTQTQVRLARRWFAPVMGQGEAYLCSVHAEDAAAAVSAALDLPGGTYNVVDDEPVTRAVFRRVLADAVGRGRLFGLPEALVLRLNPAAEMLMRSQRVSNGALRAASDWRPRYTSVRQGLPAVVAEILDGDVRPKD